MPTEGSQFIEARDVIEVAVSVENGINFEQAFAKCLLAEVRATVYQDRTLGGVQMERGSGSLVSRVVGCANRARASNDWDPHRGPGAQKCRCDWPSLHGSKMQFPKCFATKDRGKVETRKQGRAGRMKIYRVVGEESW